MPTDAFRALEDLWKIGGGDPAALERVTLTGADPLLPTDFKIGTAASAVIGASALAASELWRLRTGRGQSVSVDLRSAVAAFRSHYHKKVAINTAYFVPHATVRLEVLGFHDTPLRGEAFRIARSSTLVARQNERAI